MGTTADRKSETSGLGSENIAKELETSCTSL